MEDRRGKITGVASSHKDFAKSRNSIANTVLPLPVAASIRILLATAAAEEWELKHNDVEQVFYRWEQCCWEVGYSRT